ncbi:MAG: hypothetical protein ACRYG7_30865 [Janthinobacterium lividum]
MGLDSVALLVRFEEYVEVEVPDAVSETPKLFKKSSKPWQNQYEIL